MRLASDTQAPARVASIATYTKSGRIQVGVPDFAHGVVPGDFPAILARLKIHLGDQFEPVATWARDWSTVAVCAREHARQKWWGDEWGSASRRRLVATANGRDAARLGA